MDKLKCLLKTDVEGMEETNRPRILVKLFKENKHGKMRKYLEFLSGKEFISDDEPAELLFADNDFQSLQVEGISSIQYTLENTTLQSVCIYYSKVFDQVLHWPICLKKIFLLKPTK